MVGEGLLGAGLGGKVARGRGLVGKGWLGGVDWLVRLLGVGLVAKGRGLGEGC